jgi:hypothetical protein
MVTQVRFLGKVFWNFEKWTKKMSKNQNPKKLCPKIFECLYILFFKVLKDPCPQKLLLRFF